MVSLFVTNILRLAVEIVQLEWALTVKPDSLSLVPRTHMVEGDT